MKQGRLGDFVDFSYGKGLAAHSRREGSVPVFGSGGLVDSHDEALVKGPGVIVGRKGTVGAVYWSDEDFYPIDTTYYVVPKDNSLRLRYIYYLLSTLPLRHMNTDVAVPGLNRTNALQIKVTIASPSTQDRIIEILSTYDDLIENNRRRIQLLEQAARILYKEWFVRLRFPGHENTKITNGVPEGWEKKPLSCLCRDIRESVKPQNSPPDTPYIGLEHIPRHSITLNNWGTTNDVTSNKFKFIEGDILFGKIRPYFHKIGFTLTSGVTSSDAIVIRSTDLSFYCYTLFLLSSDDFIAFASKTVKEGSKMPRADWKFLLEAEFIVPQKKFLILFGNIINPILNQLRNLSLCNHRLTKIRDLLLPRLMNGEVTT